MTDRRAFWSTVPGFVTGAAGVLTALVGLLTLSVQAGWIGGGNSEGGTNTSVAPGVPTTTGPGTGSGGTSSPSGAAQFSVEPTALDFQPLQSKQARVAVRNTGDVPLTVKTPTVSGSGAANFTPADVDCTKKPLSPGRSCEVQVTFAAKTVGQSSAVLVIAASGATRQSEVQLKGNALVVG